MYLSAIERARQHDQPGNFTHVPKRRYHVLRGGDRTQQTFELRKKHEAYPDLTLIFSDRVLGKY